MKKKSEFAYLLVARGSRDREDRSAFMKFVEAFRSSLRGKQVEPAFLGLSRPNIAEGIEMCVRRGAEEIVILPFLIFPGKQVGPDLPLEIQTAKRRFPKIDFHYAGALALISNDRKSAVEPKIFELLRNKMTTAKRVREKN